MKESKQRYLKGAETNIDVGKKKCKWSICTV